MRISLSALLVLVLALSAWAERQPMDRYQTIVDRQMFGPLPEGFDPTKPASEAAPTRGGKAGDKQKAEEEQKLKNSVRFSVINRTPSGETMVGFSDNTNPKEPKHYYLKVGDSQDGWLVKEADPVASKVTLVKDDFEIPLEMGGATQAGQAAGGKGGAPKLGRGAGPGPGGPSRGLLGAGSLRERRALRERERAQAAAAAEEAQKVAAAEQAERQAEREAAEAAEKEAREKEREEQRAQLLAIQEELRKAREARESAKPEGTEGE